MQDAGCTNLRHYCSSSIDAPHAALAFGPWSGESLVFNDPLSSHSHTLSFVSHFALRTVKLMS